MLFRLALATAAAILSVSSTVDGQVLTNRDVSLRMARLSFPRPMAKRRAILCFCHGSPNMPRAVLLSSRW